MTEIFTTEIQLQTKGFTDIIDITDKTAKLLAESGFLEGQITLFVPGMTGGLTTIEYEPGLLKDLPDFFESIIPQDREYHHDKTWRDGNGYAHLRAALLKPSLTIPFTRKQMTLGTWQQIVLLDFDNRPRQRHIIVQIMGIKKADRP